MSTRKTLAIIIVLTFILCCTFTSCSSVEEFEEYESSVDGFEEHESQVDGLVCISIHSDFIDGYIYDQYILYDPETLVMYAFISGGNLASMSVLYNADGTPKLYTPIKIEKGE